ncbi:hypothetical protein [Caballeronia calidae]|uniref:hypothetical protein n=1 Tax=Caballeronia calidae TaxID=1777139 RepID=UPI0007891A2E|nr:hypothetical protein [Caballeronia calidae]
MTAANTATSRNRQDLLWPVYAWKVLYPDERRRSTLNLFQETLLGLARAGVRDPVELAALMALDTELVRFIIGVQLLPSGWVDSHNRVTEKGMQLLDGEEEVRASLQVGYAFQDAVSGEWMPRFTTQLSEVAPSGHNNSNRPFFVLDRDSGHKRHPFMLRESVPPALDPDRLIRAHRQYRRDVGVAGGEGRDTHPEVVFDAIECIADTPVKLYLWCELYRDESGLDSWLISDPFRIQRAVPWLRKPFAELAKGNANLARLMQRLLPDVAPDAQSAEEWMERIEESVAVEIDASHPYLGQQQLIRHHLARLLRLTERVEGQKRSHPEEMGALMNEAASLLEAVLQWLLRNWTGSAPAWPKNTNWSRQEAKAELAALQIGGAAIDSDLVNALAGQSRSVIKAALRSMDQPLKGLLAATMIVAHGNDKHPYHEVGADALQLVRLTELTNYRNKVGGHASGQQADRDEALEHARFAVQWMALFKRFY